MRQDEGFESTCRLYCAHGFYGMLFFSKAPGHILDHARNETIARPSRRQKRRSNVKETFLETRLFTQLETKKMPPAKEPKRLDLRATDRRRAKRAQRNRKPIQIQSFPLENQRTAPRDEPKGARKKTVRNSASQRKSSTGRHVFSRKRTKFHVTHLLW